MPLAVDLVGHLATAGMCFQPPQIACPAPESPFRRRHARNGVWPQLVVGGGVTPMTGLRIGATFVRGDYTRAEESITSTGSDRMPASYYDDPYLGTTFGSTARHLPGEMDHVSPPEETVGRASANRRATVSGVEVEYEFGHIAIVAEWIRDVFETTTGHAVASSGFFRVTHALSPRWRVAGRYD
jgi:hypothetical protein